MSAAVDRKKKLGRGLGALMGEIQREEPLTPRTGNDGNEIAGGETSDATGLADIPVADISPLPGQPRTRFDDEALGQLAASIA